MKIRFFALILVLLAAAIGGYFFFFKKNSAATSPVAGATVPINNTQENASGEFWTKRCSPGEKPHCEIFQRLTMKDTGQRLAEVAIGFPAERKGKGQAAVVLPLGAKLSEGIMVTIDESSPLRTQFQTCMPEGCLVLVDMPDALINMMTTGKILKIAFMDFGSGKQFNVQMSLEGFAAKLAEIRTP